MSAAEYPELQGMPEDCVTVSPWGVAPIPVLMPYGPVHDVIIQLHPLVAPEWSAHPIMSAEEFYDLDSPPGERWSDGGLGYESAAEVAALNKLTPVASATANNTALYHPDAKDVIVMLASEASDLFAQIRQAYKEFHPGGAIQYPLKSGEWESFPLSVPDDVVNEQVDQAQAGLSLVTRAETRQNIRDVYHKAIHLLWCALYGKAQSSSWRENKRIYGEKYGGDAGMELLPGPVAPPPVRPDFPPSWDPESGMEAIPAEPRPPKFVPIPAMPGGDGGYPGEFPEGGFPEGEGQYPPAPTKQRKAAAGGAGIIIGVVALVLLAAKN